MRLSSLAALSPSLAFAAAGTAFVAAIAGSTLLFSSCGTNDSGDGATSSQERTVASEAEALDLAAGGATATFPPGSLPVGAVVKLAAAEMPADFAALDGVTRASGAVECTASKDGEPIAEAAKPFTIALQIDAAAALTHEIERKPENLCFLAKTAAGNIVWRRAALTLEADGKIAKLDLKRFGIYAAVYCGDDALPGFTEASGAAPTSDPAGLVCDAVASRNICRVNPTSTKTTEGALATFQTECNQMAGTLKDEEGATCPTENRIAVCTIGDTDKRTVSYYAPYVDTAARTACQAIADKGDEGAVTYTDQGGTTKPLEKFAGNVSCHFVNDKVCQEYGPNAADTPQQQLAHCQGHANFGAAVVATCPSADFIGSCFRAELGIKYYYYTGNTMNESECSEGQDVWSSTHATGVP